MRNRRKGQNVVAIAQYRFAFALDNNSHGWFVNCNFRKRGSIHRNLTARRKLLSRVYFPRVARFSPEKLFSLAFRILPRDETTHLSSRIVDEPCESPRSLFRSCESYKTRGSTMAHIEWHAMKWNRIYRWRSAIKYLFFFSFGEKYERVSSFALSAWY